MIEIKETFLRSTWDPPLSHIVEFIKSVRAQRQSDPDGTPDYEALRRYLKELPSHIEQDDQREEVIQVEKKEDRQLDDGKEVSRQQELLIKNLCDENARLKHENQLLINQVEEL